MPYSFPSIWKVTKPSASSSSSSAGAANKPFSEILPGAASLTLGSFHAPFEPSDDNELRSRVELVEEAVAKETTPQLPPPLSEAALADSPAEQDADDLAIRTRIQARERAEELLTLIERLDASEDEEAYGDPIIFENLSAPAYDTFLEFVRRDDSLYRSLQQLRWEYSHTREEFVIRMPSTIHDGMAEFLGDRIRDWLRDLEDNADSSSVTSNQLARGGKVAQLITSYGAADIRLLASLTENRKRKDKRQADKSYRFQVAGVKTVYPGLVIEVVWSHPKSREQLAQRAKEYIVNSEGRIRTVVTIDLLDYYPDPTTDRSRQNKSGRYSVLRAKVDKRGRASIDEANSVRDEIFLTGMDEEAVPGVDSKICLLDFVSKEHVRFLPAFEGKQIEEKDIQGIHFSVSAADLSERFRNIRQAWLDEQEDGFGSTGGTLRKVEPPSKASAPVRQAATKQPLAAKATKAGKKRRLNE